MPPFPLPPPLLRPAFAPALLLRAELPMLMLLVSVGLAALLVAALPMGFVLLGAWGKEPWLELWPAGTGLALRLLLGLRVRTLPAGVLSRCRGEVAGGPAMGSSRAVAAYGAVMLNAAL